VILHWVIAFLIIAALALRLFFGLAVTPDFGPQKISMAGEMLILVLMGIRFETPPVESRRAAGYGCHTQKAAPTNAISAPLNTSPYRSTAPSRRWRAPALEPTQSTT
jgi:hypothetical protein